MTENTANVEVNEVEQPKVSEAQSNTAEKSYTQAEVDNIVKNRLARERSKKKAPQQEAESSIDQQIARDISWFEQSVGGDFDSFIKSDEFRDFLDGTALDIRAGMEKFVKLKGADYVKSNFNKTTACASTGSAKDSGAGDLKEYYTPDDVDRLTEKDLSNPEIMQRVRQSMTKWK